MKILLINPPKEQEFALFVPDDYNTKARSNQPPLGLLYLYSYMKDDFDISILDMNAKEMKISQIGDILNSYKPDIIGISCVIAKWITVRDLAKQIKIHGSIPIVVGGVNPSLYPYETLNCKEIDYVISGFGQIPFKKLCFNIKNNKNTNNIENCYTRSNCTNKIIGSFNFVNIDDFPIPDRNILPINDYTVPFFPENPSTSMITSLGCPYTCGFCACKNFKPVKLRTPENIVNEMKNIQELNIRSILFQDELFTMSTNRINSICSLIVKKDIKLNWTVRSRASLINEDSLKLMKKAGCFNIHMGIESGTDRILKEMNKNLTIKQIREAVNMIKKIGLSCSASFMLGYPNETEQEIMETINFAEELKLNNCQFFMTMPEPNTELYNNLYKKGKYTGDIYSQFTMNPDKINLKNNIASELFSREELINFINIGYSRTNNLYKIKKEKLNVC
jgi:radical SAM superfamily enzyme YgiQ (UPF0313 family)